MTYDISVREAPDQSILSIRRRLAEAALPAFIGQAFGELYGHLRLLAVDQFGGEPFVVYHDFGPEGIDAEVCVPISGDIKASGAISARVLPGGTVATTLHVGPYDELAGAYAAVTAWMAQNGFEVAGPVRERYLNGPADDVPPTAYRTVIEMPVAAIAVAAR